MENQGAILFFIAILLIVVVAYFANKKTPVQKDRLEKQKLINLGIEDLSKDDVSNLELKKIQLLNKMVDNTATIKNIMIFYIILSIIGFLTALIGYTELSNSY